MQTQLCIAHYIWLDDNHKIKFKTRVIQNFSLPFPEWSVHGTSTYQDINTSSEIILLPVKYVSIDPKYLIVTNTYQKYIIP